METKEEYLAMMAHIDRVLAQVEREWLLKYPTSRTSQLFAEAVIHAGASNMLSAAWGTPASPIEAFVFKVRGQPLMDDTFSFIQHLRGRLNLDHLTLEDAPEAKPSDSVAESSS